jgi:hypothetical protein
MLLGLALSACLAAPFPLPSVDGKPLAVTDAQRSFRSPQRFEPIRRFYEARFGPGRAAHVQWRLSGAPGARVLTLTNTDRADTWRRAVVREGDAGTVIDVTPVLRLADEPVQGRARPLVEFVFGRSPDVEKAVQGIDHTERLRR